MSSGWDAAVEASGVAQGRRDLEALIELLACDDHYIHGLRRGEREAFESMRERLEDGQTSLTEKQRTWVQEAAERCGTVADTRFTAGSVPRGREVEILVKDKPLRPPQRRSGT